MPAKKIEPIIHEANGGKMASAQTEILVSDFIRYMNDCIKEVCADGAVSALGPFVTIMSAVASFAGKAVWAFRQPQNCIHRFCLIVCGIHHHPSRSSDYEYRFRLGGADMVN
ncbi:hypothetical protein KL944_002767 [Ogataea haglerorum]|nr:hypothetical protein KL944_002767 [Ogataea haglerorum]